MWAVGFDTINFDASGDYAQAYVGSTRIGNFPQYGSPGFIGVIDTDGATINSVAIRSQSAFGHDAVFNAFDNVSYSSVASTPTPEPGTWAMMGIGLCGVVLMGRKKKLTASKALAA